MTLDLIVYELRQRARKDPLSVVVLVAVLAAPVASLLWNLSAH